MTDAASPMPSAPVRLLALDTATECLAAGVCTAHGRWLHHEAGGALASARLVPVLMELLAQGGQALDQLDAIAFGVGPGAFTGLRTACAVAQGLGFGAGIPLLAIDSLLLVAEAARAERALQADSTPHTSPASDSVQRWWVAVDARMDEVYAGEYTFDPATGDWTVTTAPALYTLAALADCWARTPPQRVAGNAPRVFAGRLPVLGAVCVEPVDAPASERSSEPASSKAMGDGRSLAQPGGRAGALLRLAAAAWSRGEAIAPDQALPLYLRDKVAQTTEERERQRAAAATATAAVPPRTDRSDV